MATIWKQTAGGFVAEPWHIVDGIAVIHVGAASEHELGRVEIAPFRDGAKSSHALLVGRQVAARVNGWPVIAGIRVLEHKDEITVGQERMYFSAESQPVVEAYQHDGSRRRPRCPVCRAEVQDGQVTVRCPGCSRIYHQIDVTQDMPTKPCWTYSTECRFCAHPTSMCGEPTWRPDEDHDQ